MTAEEVQRIVDEQIVGACQALDAALTLGRLNDASELAGVVRDLCSARDYVVPEETEDAT